MRWYLALKEEANFTSLQFVLHTYYDILDLFHGTSKHTLMMMMMMMMIIIIIIIIFIYCNWVVTRWQWLFYM